MTTRPDGIDADWVEVAFVVPRDHAGWRADLFLANRMPRVSRTRIQRMIERAGFDGRGRPLKANRLLAENERIVLYRPAPEEPDTPRCFGVLFEDDAVLAVDKPAGLPVHPTARYLRNTLTSLLKERYGERPPIIAHRLDSETSGVLLCAKTKEAERALKVAFADRAVAKTYLAITRGVPSLREGRIEAPLDFDTQSPIRVKMTHVPTGLPSLTEYRVVGKSGDLALVECRPRTGRQHQIRAHLALIGHPVLGDKIYGPDPDVFLDYLDQGLTDELVARAGARRHLLHAAAISFAHPVTGAPLTVESPLPDDMSTMVPTMVLPTMVPRTWINM